MAVLAATLPDAPALNELSAKEPIALLLDFDGTLVEIASRPDAISVPSELAADLVHASERLEGRLAVVSGRPVSELRSFLGGAPLALAGSHGCEMMSASGTAIGPPPPPLDPAVAAAVRSFTARIPTLLLEEKPLGLAIHYREAPDQESAVIRFAEQLERDHAVSLKRGKCVVEFVVPGTSKARAVERLMNAAPFVGATPVFVGDDETDEDGFAAAKALGGFGIAVGERPSLGAAFRLPTPPAVREWVRRGI